MTLSATTSSMNPKVIRCLGRARRVYVSRRRRQTLEELVSAIQLVSKGLEAVKAGYYSVFSKSLTDLEPHSGKRLDKARPVRALKFRRFRTWNLLYIDAQVAQPTNLPCLIALLIIWRLWKLTSSPDTVPPVPLVAPSLTSLYICTALPTTVQTKPHTTYEVYLLRYPFSLLLSQSLVPVALSKTTDKLPTTNPHLRQPTSNCEQPQSVESSCHNSTDLTDIELSRSLHTATLPTDTGRLD